MAAPSPALRRSIVPIAVLLLLAASVTGQTGVPSPEEFFGFRIGSEKRLAAWNEIVPYFDAVDRASPRVLVKELGKTTLGNPYIMAVVSSPDTIANLDAYQQMQRRLVDARRTSPTDVERIAREGKVVLLVGANVHSTEIGTSQMPVQLLYRLATERSALMEHVLENVILLLVPSQNPDGQQMVVDWYRKNMGTPYEDGPLPDLYHKYAGHDNNRDSYMLTQVETQMLARVTYKDWLPEVYLDIHQMGSARARIFVPPFKNPPNPNVDPLVWSEVNMLGQAMATRLHEAGKPGVLWGELYTGFWQGANSANPWWHNMVALLTETASARLATTLDQELASSESTIMGREQYRGPGSATDRDGAQSIPAPTDIQYRMNYTEPWLGGRWSLNDVVEYQMLSTLGLLEGVANNRATLKRNFYLMNRRTIDRFREGKPYAYLVPPDQRDPLAATKLLQLLQAGAAEVHVADAPFDAGGDRYPAGTHVILLAQPFGRWAKDLLEPQAYPDIRWPYPNAPLDRPYDVTAWSLGMLMGVETTLVEEPFRARLRLLTEETQAPAGRLDGSGPVFVLDPAVNASTTAVNRLLGGSATVGWALDEIEAGGERLGPGAIVVEGVRAGIMSGLARDLGLEVRSLAARPSRVLPLRAPRLAVYEPWGGNIDAGWTRWVLEQHEFAFTHARNADLLAPNLRDRFDVIVFPEMAASQILRGSQASNVRPEYRGGIGDEGVRHLHEFLDAGGTIVTLGNGAQFAIDSLRLPIENAVLSADADSFFCPGSILKISLDTHHPIAFGMPETADAMFINNGGYVATVPLPSPLVRIVGRYPTEPLLRSGWIIGESRLRGTGAVLETPVGKGRVIMHTFRVQSRGQTWGTFKLLFNSLFYGPAVSGRPTIDTMEFPLAGQP
jgi:hypothetical protein